MKTLEILSLCLLISSSTISCHRIRRHDREDPIGKEFSDLSKLQENRVEDSNEDLEQRRSFNFSTPGVDDVEENKNAPENAGSDVADAENRPVNPLNPERIEEMLKIAILKIITGDLSEADMRLLKSLNYDADQVRAIREQEMQKRKSKIAASQDKRNPQSLYETEDENLKRDRDWAEYSPREHKSFDYEAYNNQATYDYENAASTFESTFGMVNDSFSDYEDQLNSSSSSSSTEMLPELTETPIREPIIVFKISYNDSQFDSSSEEQPAFSSTEETHRFGYNGTGNYFPPATPSANSSLAPTVRRIVTDRELWNFTKNYFATTYSPVDENDIASKNVSSINEGEATIGSTQSPDEPIYRYENLPNLINGEDDHGNGEFVSISTLSSSTTETPEVAETSQSDDNATELSSTTHRAYKGLRWIQDNVYQVIPEYIDSLESGTIENETLDSLYHPTVYQNHDDVAFKNLTVTSSPSQVDGMQNNPSESDQIFRSSHNVSVENVVTLAARQQLAATLRQSGNTSTDIDSQRRNMMEEIKEIVLMLTGRANTTVNSRIVQPYQERMTMFSPTCEIPRNTDAEAWRDAYSINMQFQPNLTSEQHLVAAKLRLFKLPRDNSTATPSTSLEGAEEEEKKIRISVYVYTKPLRKNRSKKFLMDSVMVSLTTEGAHLALDVKDSYRYWRANARSMSRNHGLVVLVEDQDGHPLQPSHYIQTPHCPNSNTNLVREDEKASDNRVPALFVRACARYVRVVDGDNRITYEDCSSHREGH